MMDATRSHGTVQNAPATKRPAVAKPRPAALANILRPNTLVAFVGPPLLLLIR